MEERRELSSLKFEDTVFWYENGCKQKLIIKIRLSDECKNGICDFAITGEHYELHRSRWANISFGCLHELILKHAPQYKQFVELHLLKYNGEPSLCNIKYFFDKRNYDYIKDELRLKDKELEHILLAADDEKFLKFMLKYKGIKDRWKKEADEAIAILEEKCGAKWVNPYKPEQERFKIQWLTEDEEREVEALIEEGYYTEEAISYRRFLNKEKLIQEKKTELVKSYTKKIEKETKELELYLSFLDAGILTENIIFYDHRNLCVFNWMSYREKISKEDFDRYVQKMKENNKFTDITFHFNK